MKCALAIACFTIGLLRMNSMNWDADGNLPLGRPPVVRNKVLDCMQRLRRARVARVCEETGCKLSAVQVVMRNAAKAGELTRYRAEGAGRPFYIYEVTT